jgi:cysteinyl-tRNA synthetase
MIKSTKKRYTFTLTQKNVEAYQALMKKLNIPQSALSNAMDSFISEMTTTMQKCVDKGSFTITDLFTLMGEQMELITKEEKPDATKRKTKKNP